MPRASRATAAIACIPRATPSVPRRILFVCLGNICRSPLAEGIFRHVVESRGMSPDWTVDSAGTGAWHLGSAPDPRSIEVAARHGIDISAQRARKVAPDDFTRFDLLLGMDRSNVADLLAVAPEGSRHRVALFMDFATGRGTEVPDPYHGGPAGFDSVYRMVLDASEKLAERLCRESDEARGQVSSTT
jgi:protein-tyrosine phosphatase